MPPSPELSTLSPAEVTGAGLCIGCGSCVAQAGTSARVELDRYGNFRPSGPPAWLEGGSAALARDLFPAAAHADPLIGRYETAYVGYAANGFRAEGSSGGITSWLLVELLRRGLVDGVAHVVATDGADDGRFFRYRVSRTEEDVRAGAKSRYYPVELSEKSARLVESFAWQMGVRVEEIASVDFRRKPVCGTGARASRTASRSGGAGCCRASASSRASASRSGAG